MGVRSLCSYEVFIYAGGGGLSVLEHSTLFGLWLQSKSWKRALPDSLILFSFLKNGSALDSQVEWDRLELHKKPHWARGWCRIEFMGPSVGLEMQQWTWQVQVLPRELIYVPVVTRG